MKSFSNILLLNILFCACLHSQDSSRQDFEKKYFVEIGLVSNGLGMKIGYEPDSRVNFAILFSAFHPAFGGAVTVKPASFVFIEGMVSYIRFPKDQPGITSPGFYSDDITTIDSGLENLAFGWRTGVLIPLFPQKKFFDVAFSIGRVKTFSDEAQLNHDYTVCCIGFLFKF